MESAFLSGPDSCLGLLCPGSEVLITSRGEGTRRMKYGVHVPGGRADFVQFETLLIDTCVTPSSIPAEAIRARLRATLGGHLG